MKLTPEIVESCRAQFPGLQRVEKDQTVVFFDGPAGTQVPTCVGEAMTDYLYHRNANHHGHFSTSRESDQVLKEAHQSHADFVGADSGDEIAFGQNMTSLTFAFSRALAQTWNAGDEIIVSSLDHDANITPWTLAAEENGVTVHVVPYNDDDCSLDLEALGKLLTEKTKLVAVGCACNATGGINPVKQIAEMAHGVGAKVYLDAVHYGPHGLIDVKDWGCDFLACSDYKFFGPHLGMLWAPRATLEELAAYKVRPASNLLPTKWMTGTQSHESIVGGMACIDYIANLGRTVSGDDTLDRRSALRSAFAAIVEYEKMLSVKLLEGLSNIRGIQVLGITDPARVAERFPTFSIRHDSVSPKELAMALGEKGICVWNGNFYALEFSQRMGFEPDGMVRIGLVHYNTPAEIDRLLVAIEETVTLKVG
jgi:cysteine desulfurase family protein (TIGR01976 family)